jgi:hypothetical protein
MFGRQPRAKMARVHLAGSKCNEIRTNVAFSAITNVNTLFELKYSLFSFRFT